MLPLLYATNEIHRAQRKDVDKFSGGAMGNQKYAFRNRELWIGKT